MQGYIILKDKAGNILSENRNVVLYSAADVSAKLLAGYTEYVPRYVGFVYAPNSSSFTDPGTNRAYTWQDIANTIKAQSGNMILRPLLYERSFEATDNNYTGNKVIFSSATDKNTDPLFTGTGYESTSPQPSSDSYFQVVLISNPSAGIYIPVAYAQLDPAQSVLSNSEFVLTWGVTLR